jgi:hypothetical protein
MITSTDKIAVQTFGNAGQFDRLPLPGGGTVGGTDNDTLRHIITRLIPDAATVGRDLLCQKYAALLKKVHDDAGDAAISAWLEQHKD